MSCVASVGVVVERKHRVVELRVVMWYVNQNRVIKIQLLKALAN